MHVLCERAFVGGGMRCLTGRMPIPRGLAFARGGMQATWDTLLAFDLGCSLRTFVVVEFAKIQRRSIPRTSGRPRDDGQLSRIPAVGEAAPRLD